MNNNPTSTILPPKVSVIIPIYNTDAYLRQALDSICNQSLREIEIILVNDGSTDNSQLIIEEYAQKDARIRCLLQPNQGQGVARNNGLHLATGKYIYFMDSDDILDINTLKQCYDMCEYDNLDVVFFDAETFVEAENVHDAFSYQRKGKINEDKIWEGIHLLHYELANDLFVVAVWLCFANHAFLSKCFNGFPSGIIHEDHVFAMQIMLNASRIRYIGQPYFKRRVRADSTMTHSFSMRNIEGYTTVCTRIRNWARENEKWSPIINLYLEKTLNSVVWLSHRMTILEKIEMICRFQRLKLSTYITTKNWIIFWIKKS